MRLDPLSRSASEQAALIRDGRLSARELVDAALAAIENDDHNAFVLTCPERARAEADAVAAGDPRPLAGVPIAIKDLVVLTEGLRTANASRALGEWAPDVDSLPVARLRAAGAIIVGKTNTPEWGMRPVTEPERYGPARNPHDPALITGRLVGRQRRRGGRRARRARARQRRRRLDPHPGVVLRRRRAQADPVPGPARAGAGRMFEGFGVDGVLTRTVLDTALALDLLAGDGPSTPLGPPLPHPPFAEAAMLPPHPLRIRLCTTPPGGRRSSRSASRRPSMRPGCCSRSGTRSTSGRPTGPIPSSRSTGCASARRCSALSSSASAS